MSAPIRFNWDGEAMVPVGQTWALRADREFVVGEQYVLVEHHQRSLRSHNHFFASVSEAWKNLPEEHAQRFHSDEHLRKWALVQCGYRDERSIVCASKAEAQRVAAFIKPMDEYAVVTVRDAVVIVYTAKSQKMNAMGKDEFTRSKSDVLDLLSGMVGVTAEQLAENARKVA